MAVSIPTRRQKARPVLVEFTMTAALRVRIVGERTGIRRGHSGKVARQTPPSVSERGRQNLVVLESAERVLQGPFDAAVSHDRGSSSTKRSAGF